MGNKGTTLVGGEGHMGNKDEIKLKTCFSLKDLD